MSVENVVKVLLIDDDEDEYALIQSYFFRFSSRKFQLDWVSTGDQAHRHLEKSGVDLILLDYWLKEGTGFEFMRHHVEQLKEIPVILLTSSEDRKVAEDALKQGAADFITKDDLSPILLERAIRYAIERNNVLRKLIRREEEVVLAHELALESSRTKTEFLANMGHELRTPLGSILGMADLLRDTQLDDQQRSYVEVFKRSGDHLLQMINDILDFSAIEAGSYEVHPDRFSLREMTQKVVKIMLHRAEDKKLKLSCTVDGNLPDQVRGDSEKITQVLVSLLGNAIKFTDAGEVKLELQMCQNVENPRLKISVTDTGVGIPGDKLDRIFEYFTQADASSTRRFGGTGLGLALAKKLVEKMGGKLKVDSREGLGSLFSFELSNTFELRPGASPAEEKKSPAGKKRVLLADDAEDNRMLFEAYVKDMEVELDTAENGREAVEKIKGKAYDVIFMDLEMPVMDGYEATRLVREWERGLGKRHRIIALTAHTQQQEHDKSLKSGCDECLVKPIERAKLSKILQTEPAKPKRDPATPATMSGESGSKKPIRVVIDSDLGSLIPRYMENRFKDVEIIRKALDAGDFETIRTSGHKMKGSGGGYGFDEISRLGQLIEDAGQDGDAPAVAQSLELLRDYLERLDIRFERP